MATALDRLVRKETALGAIREIPQPDQHIGLAQIAPFLEVGTDDVIFEYLKGGLQEGLAPARAEDAEAELAQKDDLLAGEGRAAVIDWSLKDKYTASDVQRYREDLRIVQALQGIQSELRLNDPGTRLADFQRRLARDDARRRRRLDNRLEWLIMQAVEHAGISYNDGKIKFTVNYGRPSNQHNQAPTNGVWGTAASDPIGDILKVYEIMEGLYGIRPRRALCSKRVLDNMWKSDRFKAAVGLPIVGGTPNAPLDPNYLGLNGYNPTGAQAIVEQATGCRFIPYDGFYRTRAIGSTTGVNNRFTSDNKIFFLPDEDQLGEIDDTQIGFAKTLTSPHPEGEWAPGWYEWEDEQRDPWMHVRGSGVKAFPVFPYMEFTYSMVVL